MITDCFALVTSKDCLGHIKRLPWSHQKIAALEDSLAMTPDSHGTGYASPVIARERSDRSNLHGKPLNFCFNSQYTSSYSEDFTTLSNSLNKLSYSSNFT